VHEPTTGAEPGSGEPHRLGDLLYPDRSRPVVPEGAWLALVRAIAAGDQIALHSLYEQTHRMVFTMMLRIIGSRETAEELTVDLFHQVWRRASQYDPEGGPVLGWMMNQARSRALDRLRLENRRRRSGPPASGAVPVAGLDRPGEAMELEDESRVLRQAVAGLTPDERMAIETAYFAELTYREAAERLNAPLGTLKTRIRSALAKLREALDRARRTG
jgi:RNA polymerase sigma-70 factor (ECF subfamily)